MAVNLQASSSVNLPSTSLWQSAATRGGGRLALLLGGRAQCRSKRRPCVWGCTRPGIRAGQTGSKPEAKGQARKHSRSLGVVGEGEGGWASEAVTIQDMRDIPEPKWQEYPISSRLIFITALYGGLYVTGQILCNVGGIDPWATFHLTPEALIGGVLFVLPPILLSELMHQDFVVERFAPAQAIREAEEEETVDFFRGMTPAQMVFVAVMGGVVEELFFRGAVQGGVARWLQTGSRSMLDVATGIPALTEMLPPFGPFSSALAAVVTSCFAASAYFACATPRDPKIVVAAAPGSEYKDRETVKKLVGGWVQRRKLRRIYTPLIEGLITFYFGFEWLQTGSLLAPMVTHALYDMWGAGSSLLRSPSRGSQGSSSSIVQRVALADKSTKQEPSDSSST